MKTSEINTSKIRSDMLDRRQDTKKVDIIEHGIRLQPDYGYVGAADYMFRNGIEWPAIQRVLHSRILRRPMKRGRLEPGELRH